MLMLFKEPKRETLQKEEEEFDETFVVIRSLDDIGSLENTHSDLAEEMPKLEEQRAVSNKVEEDGSAKRSGNEKVEEGGALPAGHYKKGSKIYDRNKVQCPHCPFRTQSKIRLGPHMVGHKRYVKLKHSNCYKSLFKVPWVYLLCLQVRERIQQFSPSPLSASREDF
jgi:hypothetical protein